MTRPLLVASFGLAVAVGTATVIVTGAPERESTKKATPKKTGNTAAAPIDTLVVQLHRRFSDRQNVDFGYSRMTRPMVRMHLGPVAERNDLVYDAENDEGGFNVRFDSKRVRRNAAGNLEIRTEAGTWIEYGENSKNQMFPENAAERAAIDTLNRDGREIALYTFGLFDKDGKASRANGPAYLRQLGPKAPDAEKLATVARAAWTGRIPTLPGWKLRAETVFADKSCVNCHNSEFVSAGGGKKVKAGDPLGLFLIAEKE